MTAAMAEALGAHDDLEAKTPARRGTPRMETMTPPRPTASRAGPKSSKAWDAFMEAASGFARRNKEGRGGQWPTDPYLVSPSRNTLVPGPEARTPSRTRSKTQRTPIKLLGAEPQARLGIGQAARGQETYSLGLPQGEWGRDLRRGRRRGDGRCSRAKGGDPRGDHRVARPRRTATIKEVAFEVETTCGEQGMPYDVVRRPVCSSQEQEHSWGLFRSVPRARNPIFEADSSWHGPLGGHVRVWSSHWSGNGRHAEWPGLRRCWSILDVLEFIYEFAEVTFWAGEAGSSHLVAFFSTLLAVYTIALVLVGPNRMIRVFLLFAVSYQAQTVQDPPRCRSRSAVPMPTDLELWSAGQRTLREQLIEAGSAPTQPW